MVDLLAGIIIRVILVVPLVAVIVVFQFTVHLLPRCRFCIWRITRFDIQRIVPVVDIRTVHAGQVVCAGSLADGDVIQRKTFPIVLVDAQVVVDVEFLVNARSNPRRCNCPGPVAGIRVLRKQGRIGPDETGGAEFFVIVTPDELVAQVAVQPARTLLMLNLAVWVLYTPWK